MANLTDARFTEGNLMRHVSVMSFTASIGLMAIFVVDLVDVLFISMLGNDALAAAAGYASAVMFFASAVNIGLSVAAGALVAKAIGAGDDKDAREFASSVAVFSVLTGIAVPVVTLPLMEHVLAFLGASGEVAAMAERYLWIILPTTLVSGLSMTAVAVLRAYGDAQRAMYPSLMGGAVNAIFDPILIFALGLGLDGAAWATVLARLATLGFALYPAVHLYNAFAQPRLKCTVRDISIASGIAVPAILATVATPVGTALVTREMAKYGTDAVAGMAIINRMVPVVFAVILALSGSIGPIVGQNFGAGRLDRVRETFLDGIGFVALYVVSVAALLFMLREPVADLFGATGATRDLILLFCGPLALASFFNGVIFVANASFNNLGHPGYSTWVNWGRHTLGTWPLAVLGGMYWGAEGVLIGQAIGGVLFSGVAAWLALAMIANPKRPICQMSQSFRSVRRHHELCMRCNR